MDTHGEVISGIRLRRERANKRDGKAPETAPSEPTIPTALIALPLAALIGIVLALGALSAVTAHRSFPPASVVIRPEESAEPTSIHEADLTRFRPLPYPVHMR